MNKNKLSKLSKFNIFMIAISVIVCIIFAFIYLAKGDYLMMIFSIIVIFLPFTIHLFEKVFKQHLPETIKLVFLSFVFIAAVLGSIGNLYGTVTFYDKVVHFLSGIIISFAFLVGIRQLNKNQKYKRSILVICTIIFNIAVAAVWEICEFIFDLVLNMEVQRGLSDTMIDMIVAIIGGLIFVLIDGRKKKVK